MFNPFMLRFLVRILLKKLDLRSFFLLLCIVFKVRRSQASLITISQVGMGVNTFLSIFSGFFHATQQMRTLLL